jgi:hypothetical protein
VMSIHAPIVNRNKRRIRTGKLRDKRNAPKE